MAEAFLQVLLDNLNSLIQKEIGLIMGVHKEMQKLSSILTTIQAVLEDAEDRQLESKPIRDWLRKLNDLAYEIDDILDECAMEVSKLEKKNSKFSLKKILLQRKIGRRMKEMAEKLDDVAAERDKFHLREINPIDRQTQFAARRGKRETSSVLNEPDGVYGRNKEKKKIVDILVNHVKDCQQLSVLPIIGLGGLGKSTLAQLVYKNQHINEHFDPKLWVCVSEDFDLKTLVKAMIESATGRGSASDLMHLDALVRRLQELLNQKSLLWFWKKRAKRMHSTIISASYRQTASGRSVGPGPGNHSSHWARFLEFTISGIQFPYQKEGPRAFFLSPSPLIRFSCLEAKE